MSEPNEALAPTHVRAPYRFPNGTVGTKEAAALLQVSERTIYRMVTRQQLRPRILAHRYHFILEQLKALLPAEDAPRISA